MIRLDVLMLLQSRDADDKETKIELGQLFRTEGPRDDGYGTVALWNSRYAKTTRRELRGLLPDSKRIELAAILGKPRAEHLQLFLEL